MDKPIYEKKFVGSLIQVFPKRFVYKLFWGDVKTIFINQIASIKTPMLGSGIIIETTGGRRYKITTPEIEKVKESIYKAQEMI